MERNPATFAANLDRLMTLRLVRNADLARAACVSRQMVLQYRRGARIPSDDRVIGIARRLGCRPADLFTESKVQAPAMLPIAQWAQREGIPISRAKSLFELGILTGDVGADAGVHLVPVEVHAPEDSKRMIRIARRPAWVVPFAVNLDTRMKELKMMNSNMASHTGVGQSAVTHWRAGRGFPKQERLPLIAEKLGWTMDDLLAKPNAHDSAVWSLQHGRRKPSPAANTTQAHSEAA